LALLILIAPHFQAHAEKVLRLRAPAVAGSYYPAETQGLSDALTRLYNKATPPPASGRLCASMVPHAAYGFAGETIAHAFKDLRPGQFERVVILAPSNFADFEGCSVPDVEGFITPLGVIEVDREALRTLTFSSQVSLKTLQSGQQTREQGLHEEEYAIEVLLPFLQHKLGAFKLVPILVGNFSRSGGGLNRTAMENVVEQVQRIVDEKTLVVGSSNLTQYGEVFGYAPFKENVFAQIENLDKVAMTYLVSRDIDGFANYLEVTQNPIVGQLVIQMLLDLLPKQCQGVLLDYDFSGRMMNTPNQSVSYAAINYYAPVEAPTP
jgi:AmmeMemoRadiSam system protein B